MTRLLLHFWNLAATFKIRSSGKKNQYLKYVSSHLVTLAIVLHLVRLGSGASLSKGQRRQYHQRRDVPGLYLQRRAWLKKQLFVPPA